MYRCSDTEALERAKDAIGIHRCFLGNLFIFRMFSVVLFDPQGSVWVMILPTPNPSFPQRYADMLFVSPAVIPCSSFVHFVWDLVWDGF